MHQKKGITLISLVITIILMLILAGVSISAGINAYNNSVVTDFVSKMNIIQEQVNTSYTKIKNGDTTPLDYGKRIDSLSTELQNKINTALAGMDSTNFLYYDIEDLKKIGVDGINQYVVINFTTREVYSLTGVEYEGVMHYSQYDLPGGQKNINYVEQSEVSPEFSVIKKNYGLYATLHIQDIVYKGNINGGSLYYGVVTDDTTTPVKVDYWQEISGDSVDVDKSAKYAIKLVDKANNQTIKLVDVALVNSPNLTDGMTPVVYDETASKWKKVSQEEMGIWYDYAEKKWANVMLNDGLVLDSSGYVTTMGSMFVWIPRYAYNITSNYHSNSTGNINVKFVKGTTNLTTDANSTKIEATSGKNKWNIHPAFCDESQNSYANSGWNKELTGIWVAKFEASSTNTSATNGGGDVTNLSIKVLPGVVSWRGISENNIFNNCKNMNLVGNIYGLNTEVTPHQMKNSEWGAVSYLTHSKYGNEVEPYINNSTTFITGNAAATANAVGASGKVNEYNTTGRSKG